MSIEKFEYKYNLEVNLDDTVNVFDLLTNLKNTKLLKNLRYIWKKSCMARSREFKRKYEFARTRSFAVLSLFV